MPPNVEHAAENRAADENLYRRRSIKLPDFSIVSEADMILKLLDCEARLAVDFEKKTRWPSVHIDDLELIQKDRGALKAMIGWLTSWEKCGAQVKPEKTNE